MSGGRLDNNVGERLLQYVTRIENLEGEIKDLQADKSEVYKECKAIGFDTKVLKQVIALRRKDKQERDEQDLVLGMYEDAIERAEAARFLK